VTSTADDGPGSLRQAILDANAHTGADTITFAVPGDGVQTIQPLSALPAVTDAVTIDGTTQPGYAGSPLIEIDGHLAGTGADGLSISGNFTGTIFVKALLINRFVGRGISVLNAGASGSSVVIQGDRIGTDPSGTQALGNGTGVYISVSAAHVTIGGTAAGAGNVISGNSGLGIYIFTGSSQVIQGNRIGTDPTGTQALGNGGGIEAHGFGDYVTIGGTAANAGNVISGNRGAGIYLGDAFGVVQGNRIGTDVTGTRALGNGLGLYQGDGSVTVGGTAVGAGNVISGNAGDGIQLGYGSVIQGNLIGTDVTGSQPLGNGGNGIRVFGYFQSLGNTIGGTAAGAGNIISANGGDGISMPAAGMLNSVIHNVVQGNLIGTDVTGTQPLGNGGNGITLTTLSGSGGVGINTIGGTASGAGNVIAANTGSGVYLSGAITSRNVIQGNLIGLDRAGTAALANGGDGVAVVNGASANTIGGTAPAARNVISGNGGEGVLLAASGTTNNLVEGNFIGTNAAGTLALVKCAGRRGPAGRRLDQHHRRHGGRGAQRHFLQRPVGGLG
jgi:titin